MMQRQLCIKLLSKFSQNSSSLLKTNPNPFFQQSLSQHSTLSRSHLWNGNGVLGKTGNGFFKPPVLGQRFFSNTLFKRQSKDSIFTKVWVYSRRKFHSFDSQYGSSRSFLRRLTPDGVVIGLIVANAAVFMLWKVADTQFMVNNFMISVDNFKSGRLHTMITSAFSHRDPWHLFSNMIGLYFFGLSVGRSFGAEYLLKLYLSGAVVGSIFYLAYNAFQAQSSQGRHMFGIDPSKIPGLGASGAVNAIMLLDIFLFPTKTILFDLIIPVPAILFGVFIIGKDLMRIFEGDTEVSGSAHLGGATVAAIAWAQIRRGRFRRF